MNAFGGEILQQSLRPDGILLLKTFADDRCVNINAL
jgi:hypothetical protein